MCVCIFRKQDLSTNNTRLPRNEKNERSKGLCFWLERSTLEYWIKLLHKTPANLSPLMEGNVHPNAQYASLYAMCTLVRNSYAHPFT